MESCQQKYGGHVMELSQYTDELRDSSNQVISKLYDLIEADQVHLIGMVLFESNLELYVKDKILSKAKKSTKEYQVDMSDVVAAHNQILRRLNNLSKRRDN